MDIFSPSPTPPLPTRNPHHHVLPPISPSPASVELIPPPLFSKRTRLAPDAIHVTVVEISSPVSSSNPIPPYPSSLRSSESWESEDSVSSLPSSPMSLSRSFSYSSSPTSSWATFTWTPSRPHTLRRKPSPRRETLRSLRAKESDACLQRIYDRQTIAYLDGKMFSPPKTRSKLGVEIGD